MKRIISLFLVVVTFISCLAINISANEGIVSDEGRMLFDDVESGRWYAPAVEFCYTNGIIKGVETYRFNPEDGLTRAQFVVMLANLEGAPAYPDGFDKFVDVKKSHWYYNSVVWAYNEGIVSGVSEDRFAPASIITRAQIARMMKQYMEKKYSVEIDESCLDRFADKSSIPDWAYDGMKYAVSAGLISGMSETSVAPNSTLTRAQAARIIMSFMKDYKCRDCEHIFADATCTVGTKCTLCGIVTTLPNGHIIQTANCTYDGICRVCGTTVKAAGHAYREATCQAPMTCRRCGVTKGTVSNHRSTQATCTEYSRCPWCNIIVGPKKDHDWKFIACGQPMECKNCGAKGKIFNHNWNSGNCTIPRHCAICGKTDGEAPGHKFVDGGNCTVCGRTSPYQTLWYAVKKNGVYDYESHSFTYSRLNEAGDAVSSLIYTCSDTTVYTMYMKAFSDGSMSITLIELAKNGTVTNVAYMYADRNGNVVTDAEGFVDAKGFKNGVLPSFSYFEGDRSKMYEARLEASAAIDEALKEANLTMKPISGHTVKDFGFNNY